MATASTGNPLLTPWAGITMGAGCHFNIFAACLEKPRVNPAVFFTGEPHHSASSISPRAMPVPLPGYPWPGPPLGAALAPAAPSGAAHGSAAGAAQPGGSNPPPLPAAPTGASSFCLHSFRAGQPRASWGGWESPGRKGREAGETEPSPRCCCRSCAGAGAVDVAPQS